MVHIKKNLKKKKKKMRGHSTGRQTAWGGTQKWRARQGQEEMGPEMPLCLLMSCVLACQSSSDTEASIHSWAPLFLQSLPFSALPSLFLFSVPLLPLTYVD